MPPAFVLSQDQTLKFIPDLLKVVAYSKADPSSGPPNVRIDARTSSDPTPPSAHPFPLLHNLKQQSPAGLRPIGPTPSRGRAYRPTNYPRQHRFLTWHRQTDRQTRNPVSARCALHAACAAYHTSFSMEEPEPTPERGAATLGDKNPRHLVQSGPEKLPNTLPGEASRHLRQDAQTRAPPHPKASNANPSIHKAGSNCVRPVI